MTSFHDDFEPTSDTTTKRGIIVLAVFIVMLAGFFIWYQNRFSSSGIAQHRDNREGDGLFGGLRESDSLVNNDDEDHDGLSRSEEEAAQTDSTQIDSDFDGLTDGEEVKTYKTNPRQADSDGDGKSDGEEIKNRFDPLNPSATATWPPAPQSLSTN